VLPGRRHGLRLTFLQEEFAFDAKEFSDAPALLVGVRSRQRLVDDREPFGSLTVTTESVRNLGENWSVKESKRIMRDEANAVRRSSNPAPMLPRLMSSMPSKQRPPRVHSSTACLAERSMSAFT
jgi:hypothetical protein